MLNRRNQVPVIGVIGGIGSGKSFLAGLLRDRKPQQVQIVSGDAAGHEVLKEDSVKQQIRSRFGDGMFDENGEINRRKLSEVVFGAAGPQKSARAELEAIVHPRIKQLLSQQIAEAKALPETQAVILDAALLLEAGWREFCDAVIFIETPFEQRLEQVERTRGWTQEILRLREESQLPLETKRRAAGHVVDNSHGAETAVAEMDRIVSQLIDRRDCLTAD